MKFEAGKKYVSTAVSDVDENGEKLIYLCVGFNRDREPVLEYPGINNRYYFAVRTPMTFTEYEEPKYAHYALMQNEKTKDLFLTSAHLTPHSLTSYIKASAKHGYKALVTHKQLVG
jgi:hypothetical protein